jgi:hypothetical protein
MAGSRRSACAVASDSTKSGAKMDIVLTWERPATPRRTSTSDCSKSVPTLPVSATRVDSGSSSMNAPILDSVRPQEKPNTSLDGDPPPVTLAPMPLQARGSVQSLS